MMWLSLMVRKKRRQSVKKSGVVIIQVPEGIDFDGGKARLIFGLAGKDGGHLEILTAIA
jgi:PTS system mannitol-specific IIC component